MKKQSVPKTDSIKKLAEFWDNHDLTDFEDELNEVSAPVFVRRNGSARAASISIPLAPREARAVKAMANARGVSPQRLVRDWVLKKIGRRTGSGSMRRSA